MKKIGLICLATLMLGMTSGGSTWARGGHGGHGGHWGHHGGWGGYYGGFYPGYGFGAFGLGLGLGYGMGYGGYGYGGYGYGAPYYSPYYAYPSVVTVPAAPSTYIQQQPYNQQQQQQDAMQSAPQAPVNYWHYCRNPEGYYPYIRKCPDGWLQVVPQTQPNN